jgi:hypothetical protein
MGETAYLASLEIRIRRLALLEEAAVRQQAWSTARMAVLKRTALQEYRHHLWASRWSSNHG